MKLLHRSHRWPVGIAGALLLNLGVGVQLMRVANADQHFAVEPDYYRRALAWDSTQAQLVRNAELGWQPAVHLGPVDSASGALLELQLADRSGAALGGATITAEARQVAHAGEVLVLEFDPTSVAGVYRAREPLTRTGLHELRISATVGSERFTAHLRLEAFRDAVAQVVTARPGDAPAR